jgi:hypothetical protein
MANATRNGILIGAIIVAGVIAWWVTVHWFGRGTREILDAPLYAEMQAIEISHRSDPGVEPIFLRRAVRGRYDIVGLPSGNPKFPLTWILLNSGGGTKSIYIMPPAAGLQVHCQYIVTLNLRTKVDSAVESLLRSKCTP